VIQRVFTWPPFIWNHAVDGIRQNLHSSRKHQTGPGKLGSVPRGAGWVREPVGFLALLGD